jgi:transposase
MSMKPRPWAEIPAETAEVVRAALPKGTRVTRLRDALGPVFDDADFADWFAAEGRAGLPPAMLALVLVLQHMENLTDREAADAVRSRLDWKYALSRELRDPGFDFSVLSEFRDRLAADDRAGLLLDRMLAAAAAAGLLRPGGRARTDATHVISGVRKLNRLELVGETLRAALEQLAQVDPAWLAAHLDPEWEKRYGRRVEAGRLPRGDAARAAWAARTGADGGGLLAALDAPGAPDWLSRLPAVAALRRVWAEQYAPGPGGAPRWRAVAELPPSADKTESPYDADARFSIKRDTEWSGYKIHLSETCPADLPHLVTHVETTAATLPDCEALEPVHAGMAGRGLTPGEHLVDAGYATVEAVEKAAVAGIALVGPIAVDTSPQARAGRGFDRSAFAIDWDARTAVCPAGKASATWADTTTAGADRPGAAVVFAKRDCAGCPLRPDCTTSRTGRSLTLPPRQVHELQTRLRAEQATEDWQHRYNQRAGVEGTISEAVRGYGVRRCRYRGHAKTHVQHVLTACAINAGRIADWHERGGMPAPGRNPSHLVALCRAVKAKG